MNFKFDLQLFDGASSVTVNTNIMGDINFAEGVFSIGSGNGSLFTSVGTANSANKSYIPGKANISLAGTFGGNISGTGYSGNTSMTWNGEWENTSHSVAPTTSITVSYKNDSMFLLDFDKTNLSLTSGSIIGTGGTFAENANYSYETNISVTGLSLLQDVSSDVATFKISSDKVKTLNLGGYAGTVELAESANTGMSIIANGAGAATATAVTGGQTLKFTASGISFSGKNINVTAGNALNLLATGNTAVLTEGSTLTNVSIGKTNDGKVGFDAKGAANINLGEGTDGANVVLSANADVDSVLYKVKNLTYTADADNTSLSLRDLTDSSVSFIGNGKKTTLNLNVTGSSATMDLGAITSSTVNATLSGAKDTLNFTSISKSSTNVTINYAGTALNFGELTESDVKVNFTGSGYKSLMSLTGMTKGSSIVFSKTGNSFGAKLIDKSKLSKTSVAYNSINNKLLLEAYGENTYNFGEGTDGVDVVLNANANANVTSALSGVINTSYSAAGDNTKLTLTGVTNSDITFYSGSAVSGMNWNLGAFTGSTVNTSDINGTNGTLAFTSISDSNAIFNIKGKKNVLNFGSATNSDITATVSGESSSVKADSLTGVTATLSATKDFVSFNLGNVTSSTVNAELKKYYDSLIFTTLSNTLTNVTVGDNSVTLDLGALTDSDVNVNFGGNYGTETMSVTSMTKDSSVVLGKTGSNSAAVLLDGSKFSGTKVGYYSDKLRLDASGEATYNLGEGANDVTVYLNPNANVTSALSGANDMTYRSHSEDTRLTLTGVTNSTVKFDVTQNPYWNLGTVTGSTINSSTINGTGGTLAFTSVSDSNATFTVQGTNNTLDFGKFTSSAVNATLSGSNDKFNLGDVTSSTVNATLSGEGESVTAGDVTSSTVTATLSGANAKFTAGDFTSSTVNATLSGENASVTANNVTSSTVAATLSGANAKFTAGDFTSSTVDATLSGEGASVTAGDVTSSTVTATLSGNNAKFTAGDLTSSTVDATLSGASDTLTFTSLSYTATNVTVNGANATLDLGELTKSDANVVLGANGSLSSMSLKGMDEASNFLLKATGTAATVEFVKGSKFSGTGVSAAGGKLQLLANDDATYKFGEATNNAEVLTGSNSVKSSISGINNIKYTANGNGGKLTLEDFTNSDADFSITGNNASMNLGDIDNSTAELEVSATANNAKFTAGDLTSSTVNATLSGAGDTLTFTSLSYTATNVTVSGANATLDLGELTKSDAKVVLGSNGSVNGMSLTSITQDSSFVLQDTTGEKVAELLDGSKFSGTGVSVAGGKLQLLTKDDAIYNFDSSTTGVEVYVDAADTTTETSLSGVQDIAYTVAKAAELDFTKVDASKANIKLASGSKGAVLDIDNADENSEISIIAEENGNSGDDIDAKIDLSGIGVETLTLGADEDLGLEVYNWAFKDGEGKANVLDVGNTSLSVMSGGIAGNIATLNVGENSVVMTSTTATLEKGANFDIVKDDTAYNTLILNDDYVFQSEDDLSDVDIFIGKTLNLGTSTKKTRITLDHKLYKDPAYFTEDTAAYYGVTTVIGSSEAAGFIIGDMGTSAVEIHGMAHGDSLYAGGSVSENTISSAAGKRAYIGTSANSGKNHIILKDENGNDTNNYEFINADGSNEDTADVTALMWDGGSYINVAENEDGTLNYRFGNNSSNYLSVDGIKAGEYTTWYNDNMDASDNKKAKIDATLTGDSLTYADNIAFYLGNGLGNSKITMNEGDSNKKVNYDGGGVLMEIYEIDGSKGGDGNYLQAGADVKSTVKASDLGATTISGGQTKGVDSTADTLIGGEYGATTFIIGAEMGDDEIIGLKSGDTVKFLTGKYGDIAGVGVTVSDTYLAADFGASKVSATLKTNLADLKDFTVEFEDATFKWDGMYWTQYNK